MKTKSYETRYIERGLSSEKGDRLVEIATLRRLVELAPAEIRTKLEVLVNCDIKQCSYTGRRVVRSNPAYIKYMNLIYDYEKASGKNHSGYSMNYRAIINGLHDRKNYKLIELR